jgi:chitin disaccharide deacetylase
VCFDRSGHSIWATGTDSDLKRLVINADDFGISDGATEAIVDAHLNGVLTSTSVMANMPGFDAACRGRESAPNLGYGAHLSLNVGRPLLGADAVPLLCDSAGWLHSSYLVHVVRSRRVEYRQQAARELKAQTERLFDHGFRLDHLNGQSSLHMIPAVHDLFLEIQAARGIPYVRVTGEPFFGHPGVNISGTVKNAILRVCRVLCDSPPTPVSCIGVTRTGYMSERALLYYLERIGGGNTELVLHPGTGEVNHDAAFQPWVTRYLRSRHRVEEWKALKAGEIRDAVSRLGIELCTFRQLLP